MNRKWFISSALVCFGALSIVSCNDDNEDNSPMDPGPDQNVVELAQANDDLSTLEAALVRFPDLVSTLSADGEFTVFAPTNEAFENLLDAIGQSSLDDVPDAVVRDILEYHVIAGSAVESTELTSGDVETVVGEDISVSVSNGVSLNGSAMVSTPDVMASNGVVHVIDEVLVPPSMMPVVGTIVAPAYFNKNFTTLIAAVNAASPSIMEALLSATPKTLFAPTNDAFTAAGITELPDEETLNAVLSYHVIGAEVPSSAIADGSSSAETLNGMIYLSKNSSGVFINGNTQVVTPDIEASNGVVHVINRTLMPPMQTIAEIAVGYSTASTPEFTQLVAALARTEGEGDNDLLAAVSAEDANLTVFAPTDAAFQELYTALGVEGVDEIPLATLIAVLKHHVVAGRVFSSDLSSGSVGTLNNDVMIDLSADPPTVTGASGGSNVANLQTMLLNVHATNGVIHVIDKVLIP